MIFCSCGSAKATSTVIIRFSPVDLVGAADKGIDQRRRHRVKDFAHRHAGQFAGEVEGHMQFDLARLLAERRKGPDAGQVGKGLV